jgi:hypothetical protein
MQVNRVLVVNSRTGEVAWRNVTYSPIPKWAGTYRQSNTIAFPHYERHRDRINIFYGR